MEVRRESLSFIHQKQRTKMSSFITTQRCDSSLTFTPLARPIVKGGTKQNKFSSKKDKLKVSKFYPKKELQFFIFGWGGEVFRPHQKVAMCTCRYNFLEPPQMMSCYC